MTVNLTDTEEKQLRLVRRGRETNERLPHHGPTIELLIGKGLLRATGMSVDLTAEGNAVLDGLP